MENNTKRLERSRTNRVIAGVCGGLADYFKIDIALMRVLFVVATICGSFGFWMYVILWIVVPEEYALGPGNINENSYDDTIDITPNEAREEKKSVNGAMIASLILIFIGVMALVDNFTPIAWVWKLWPVPLIIIGVILLINSTKNNGNE
jgi:phage shock protein PspC (stress-responsive transcriptional regulator)